ncbi:DUF948 domain-containing protein [Candidatus Poribacteria bacterium]
MGALNVINVIILGILAVASAVLVIFLAPALKELRRTLGKIQGMADEEINPLITQVRELVAETRPKIDSITQKIESMTEDEIKPMTNNVKEITATVNEEIAKVNGIVDTVGDMVSRTHDVVSLYQDKAVIPAIEMISLWDGIKKGVSVFLGRE